MQHCVCIVVVCVPVSLLASPLGLCCKADKLQKTNLNAAHSVASDQDGVAKNSAAADSDPS